MYKFVSLRKIRATGRSGCKWCVAVEPNTCSVPEAQVVYLVATQHIIDLLLGSGRGYGFNEGKWQEQKARENATINIETVLATAKDRELKELPYN